MFPNKTKGNNGIVNGINHKDSVCDRHQYINRFNTVCSTYSECDGKIIYRTNNIQYSNQRITVYVEVPIFI